MYDNYQCINCINSNSLFLAKNINNYDKMKEYTKYFNKNYKKDDIKTILFELLNLIKNTNEYKLYFNGDDPTIQANLFIKSYNRYKIIDIYMYKYIINFKPLTQILINKYHFPKNLFPIY